jgi:hypothetical protein
MNKFYDTRLINSFVAGALTAYDLPDLAASLAPRKLTLINLKDGEGNLIDIKEENKSIKIIKTAWQAKNAGEQLQIIENKSGINPDYL